MKRIVKKWKYLNENYDLFLLFLGMYFYIYLPIISLSTFIPIPSIATKVLMIISAALIIFALPIIIKKITFIDLFMIASFFVLNLFSFVVFENNRSDIFAGIKIFFTSLLFYFITFRFCQYNQKRVDVVSFGSLVNILALLIVSIVNMRRNYGENMTLCYETLFFTSICLSYVFFQKKKNYKIFLFSSVILAGVTAIYFFGSRGPLFFIVLLLLIETYLKIKTKRMKKVFIISFALVIIVLLIIPFICVPAYNNGNVIAKKILEAYNKILSLSGREYLYSIEMSGFTYSPIVGYGLYGDRFLSIGFIFSNPQTTNFRSLILSPNTTYSHNLIVELLVSFGAPLTFVLIVFFIVFIFNYLLPAIKDKQCSNIFVLPLLITGFLSLFLSNSFAVSNYFWGLLGSCVFLFLNERNSSSSNKVNSILTDSLFFEMNI